MRHIATSNWFMDWQKYPRSRTSIRVRQPEALDSIKCHTFPCMDGRILDILLHNSTLQKYFAPQIVLFCLLNQFARSMHFWCNQCKWSVCGMHHHHHDCVCSIKCSLTALTPYPKPILQLWINSQRCSQPPQAVFSLIHWQITPKSARNYHCGWLQQSDAGMKACDRSKAIESACASYQVHWQCFISVFFFQNLNNVITIHNWILSYIYNCLTSMIGAVQ